MHQNEQRPSNVAPFQEWREAVDSHLYEIYGITISDAGIDDDRLANHFQSDETPNDFVDWFGGKYDLNRKGDYLWPLRIAP